MVDCSGTKISPFAPDADVRLVHPPARTTDRLRPRNAFSNAGSSLIAQRVGHVLAHASQDYIEPIVQAFEHAGHRWILRRHRAFSRSWRSAS
jgi:hypothetical protein